MKDLLRVLAGASVSASLMISGADVMAQGCDRCSGTPHASHVHSCPSCDVPSNTHCGCNHAPSKSIFEQGLDRFDKAGDRIECRLGPRVSLFKKRRPESTCGCETKSIDPTCGCESAKAVDPSCGCESAKVAPTCGCETCTTSIAKESAMINYPPIVQRSNSIPNLESRKYGYNDQPVVRSGESQNKGKLSDVSPTESDRVNRLPSIASEPNTSGTARVESNVTPDINSTAIPNTTPLTRRPSDVSTKKPIGPVPFQKDMRVPQADDHKTNATNPSETESTNHLESIPDVLVDPFRDDVSDNGPRPMVPTLLQRRSSGAVQPASHHMDASVSYNDVTTAIAPPRITERQRTLLQGADASVDSDVSNDNTQSIEQLPVKYTVRRKIDGNDTSDAPKVSRKLVPLKRGK